MTFLRALSRFPELAKKHKVAFLGCINILHIAYDLSSHLVSTLSAASEHGLSKLPITLSSATAGLLAVPPRLRVVTQGGRPIQVSAQSSGGLLRCSTTVKLHRRRRAGQQHAMPLSSSCPVASLRLSFLLGVVLALFPLHSFKISALFRAA